MADSFVRVPADSVGKKIDAASLDVGADTVHRQRIVIGDNSATAQFATVTNGALLCAGTFSIGGTPTVALAAGTNNIGTINNISATVNVAGTFTISTIDKISATVAVTGTVSLAAGSILDSISATVGVKGQVSLGPGTSNIGFLNNISATVVVAGEIAAGSSLSTTNKPVLIGGNDSAGGAGGVARTLLLDTSGRVVLGAGTNLIGAVSNAAGTALMGAVSLAAGTANIGFINNISATVVVAGAISLAAGANVIGDLNAISRTVQVAIGTPFTLQGISTTVTVQGNINISATATAIIGGFLDPSGQQRNVVDSANTALRVNVVAGSSGGVSQVDGTSFTSQAANFVPIGGIFDDAATDTLSENDAGVVRLTTNRGFHVNLRTDGGTKMDDSTNSALRVNVVAGGAGGGAVFGQISNGASLSTTNVPVLIGGNDSAGGAGGVARTLLLDTSGRIILGAGAQNIGTINNISATIGITGTVALAAGTVINNISATVIVAGVVSLGAGTNNIGFINNISATVIVAGELSAGASLSNINKPVLIGGNDSVGGGVVRTLLLDTSGRLILGAGAQNIGTINDISRTVQVAIGTPFILQGISTTVLVAMSNQTLQGISTTVQVAVGTPFTIQAISTTVTCAVNGTVAHSLSVTAGNAPVIWGMRAHLSSSAAVANKAATYAWGDKFGRQVVINNHPSLLPTASHGPKCVTLSTSATVALVAAPGAGLSIFVTMIACTNGSATLTRGDVYAASQTASCVAQMYMAASGGGFVMKYDPPIQILSNTALNSRVKPNVSQAIFNVHFYVGPK